MKTLLTLFLSLIVYLSANGQITLEQTYTPSIGQYFYMTNIGYDNYKYVIEDYNNSEINLYNLDHSPYLLNIPTPVPLGIYEVMYITMDLFDCDSSNIEYVLSAPTTGNETFYVYRMDGTLLWSKDSVQGPYCYGCHGGSLVDKPIVNTPDGAKMTLFDPFGNYYVYSLCGELPAAIDEIEHNKSTVNVYPNPSSGLVTFDVTELTNSNDCEILIFNSAMQSITTKKIESGTDKIKFNDDLANGTYFYCIKERSKVIKTGKFIISK